MRLKKIYIGVGIVLIAVCVMGLNKKELFNDYFIKEKLQYLSNYLSKNYLYEFDEEKGLEAIYSGYVGGAENSVTYYLDPYDYHQAVINDAGDYYGCGIVMMWNMDGQSLIVTEVIKDSPADRAGVKVGDKITKVNDIPVLLSNSSQLIETAFSTQPVDRRFLVTHEGKEEEVILKPEEVTLVDIKPQMMGEVLYIKLASIKSGTSERVNRLLEEEAYTKAKGIILDIRNLTTNNIEEIGKLCDLFQNEGIAFKVRTKKENMTDYTMTEGTSDKKLCLIVNTATRSGGEALALGLMDRATIIGSETGGLNYLRTLVALEDGSGMSIGSGIIFDKYGNELTAESIRLDERVFISEAEKLEILETGTIRQENDSYIKAALKKF